MGLSDGDCFVKLDIVKALSQVFFFVDPEERRKMLGSFMDTDSSVSNFFIRQFKVNALIRVFTLVSDEDQKNIQIKLIELLSSNLTEDRKVAMLALVQVYALLPLNIQEVVLASCMAGLSDPSFLKRSTSMQALSHIFPFLSVEIQQSSLASFIAGLSHPMSYVAQSAARALIDVFPRLPIQGQEAVRTKILAIASEDRADISRAATDAIALHVLKHDFPFEGLEGSCNPEIAFAFQNHMKTMTREKRARVADESHRSDDSLVLRDKRAKTK